MGAPGGASQLSFPGGCQGERPSPSVSSPPRPADIGDGPGAGKCLSIIKNGCSVMQEETSKTCDGFSRSMPGFAVVCGGTGCHPPAVTVLTSVSFCSEKNSAPPKYLNFSYFCPFPGLFLAKEAVCAWPGVLLLPVTPSGTWGLLVLKLVVPPGCGSCSISAWGSAANPSSSLDTDGFSD